MVRAVGLLVMSVSLTTAAAPSARDVAKAKDLFERGRVAFEKSDYQAAVEHFRTGYGLVARPLFLFNTAQALRKWGERQHDDRELLSQARTEYRRYIDTSALDEPERVDAVRHLLELEGKLQSAAQRPTDAPTKAVLEPTVAEPPQVPPPAIAVAEPTWFGRNWGWVLAAGLVVAAGASVAVGVSVNACHASLGCVDAQR